MTEFIDFHRQAWEDYKYWQTQDKKTLVKTNNLIKEIERSGSKGLGHAEILKGELSNWSSVRIDHMNRLIYKVEDGVVVILSCRGHYGDR